MPQGDDQQGEGAFNRCPLIGDPDAEVDSEPIQCRVAGFFFMIQGKNKMTEDYAQFFRILSDVSKSIHSGTSVRGVLESIVRNITEILNAKGCIFWILDQERGSIDNMISHGFNYQSLTKVDFPTLMKIFNREYGERIFIKDARNDPRIPNLERLGKMRVGSVTGIFFEIVDSYTGLLAVYFTNYRQLGKGEEELVTALGEQASIALQRALRYDEEMLGILGQMNIPYPFTVPSALPPLPLWIAIVHRIQTLLP